MTINKNKTYQHNVGDNIKLWREFKGIKQEDLAKRIGKSKTTLSKIETNKEAVNANIMEDIAEVLGIDVTQLFTSPQQQFTITNSPNSNNGINHGTKIVNNIDNSFLEKLMVMMDKISNKLSGK